jgi:hypothetical protein
MGGTWEIRPSDEQINALYQKKEKYSMASKEK